MYIMNTIWTLWEYAAQSNSILWFLFFLPIVALKRWWIEKNPRCISLDVNHSEFGQRLLQMCRTLQKHLMGHTQSFLSDHILCCSVQIQYGGCQIQQGWLIFFRELFSMINGLITIAAPPSSSNAHKRDTSMWLEGWKWGKRSSTENRGRQKMEKQRERRRGVADKTNNIKPISQWMWESFHRYADWCLFLQQLWGLSTSTANKWDASFFTRHNETKQEWTV